MEEWVKDLCRILRITKVNLAFNFSEIYKHGPRETETLLNSIQENLGSAIRFRWKALASSHLMHGKAYALAQMTGSKVSDGAVLVTSANFTRPGFKGKNVEIGYLSTNIEDVLDFRKCYCALWDDLGRDVRSSILKEEQYLLKYALLSSGKFIHKWSGNLRQLVGIRYELMPRAKEMGTIPPELEAIGLEPADTFSMQILELNDLPEKKISSSFIRRFTIETYWGDGARLMHGIQYAEHSEMQTNLFVNFENQQRERNWKQRNMKHFKYNMILPIEI